MASPKLRLLAGVTAAAVAVALGGLPAQGAAPAPAAIHTGADAVRPGEQFRLVAFGPPGQQAKASFTMGGQSFTGGAALPLVEVPAPGGGGSGTYMSAPVTVGASDYLYGPVAVTVGAASAQTQPLAVRGRLPAPRLLSPAADAQVGNGGVLVQVDAGPDPELAITADVAGMPFRLPLAYNSTTGKHEATLSHAVLGGRQFADRPLVIHTADPVGNSADLEQEVRLSANPAPPRARVVVAAPPDGRNGWYRSQPQLTLEAEAGAAVSYRVVVNGADGPSGSFTASAEAPAIAVDLGGQAAAGSYSLRFAAAMAGRAAGSGRLDWRFDDAAPAAPGLQLTDAAGRPLPASPAAVRQRVVLAAVAGEPAAEVEVWVNTTPYRVRLDGSGQATFALALPEGAVNVWARQADGAGNTSANSPAVALAVAADSSTVTFSQLDDTRVRVEAPEPARTEPERSRIWLNGEAVSTSPWVTDLRAELDFPVAPGPGQLNVFVMNLESASGRTGDVGLFSGPVDPGVSYRAAGSLGEVRFPTGGLPTAGFLSLAAGVTDTTPVPQGWEALSVIDLVYKVGGSAKDQAIDVDLDLVVRPAAGVDPATFPQHLRLFFPSPESWVLGDGTRARLTGTAPAGEAAVAKIHFSRPGRYLLGTRSGPPRLTIDDPNPLGTTVKPTPGGSIAIAGTTSNAAQVAVTVGGVEKAATVPTGGRYQLSLPLSQLAEGANTVAVVATDPVGNSARLEGTIVRDSIAELAVLRPLGSQGVAGDLVLVEGSAEAGGTVTILGPGGQRVLAGGGPFLVALPLGDGGTVSITATDLMGNPSQAFTAQVAADNTPPVLAVVNGPAETTVNGGILRVSLDEPATVQLFDGKRKVGEAQALVAGQKDVPFNLGRGPGRYALRVVARDGAGNHSATLHPLAYEPGALALSAEAPARAEPGNATITGTTRPGVLIQAAVDSGPGHVVGKAAADGGYSVQVNLGAAPGPRSVSLTAIDSNTGRQSSSRTLTIEVVDEPPALLALTPADGTVISAATVDMTLEASEPVTVSVNGLTAGSPEAAARHTFPVSLDEGTNPITITMTDRSGLASTSQIVLVRDTTPPRAVRLTPPNGSTTTRSRIDLQVNLTEAAVLMVGDETRGDGQPATVHGVTLTLARGQNQFRLTMTDATGNREELLYTITRTATGSTPGGGGGGGGVTPAPAGDPPPLNLDHPDGVSYTNQPTFTLRGSTSADAAVSISHNGTAVESGLSVNGGTFEAMVTLVAGENRLVVTARRQGAAVSAEVVVHLDQVAPLVGLEIPMTTELAVVDAWVLSEPGAAIYLNGQYQGEADAAGKLAFTLNLAMGDNPLTVAAVDRAGNAGSPLSLVVRRLAAAQPVPLPGPVPLPEPEPVPAPAPGPLPLPQPAPGPLPEPEPFPLPGPVPDFTDLDGHWAQEVVLAMAGRGYVRGYPDGSFRPDQIITRAELAVLLMRALALSPDTTPDLPFADQDEIGLWAQPWIARARALGLVQGFPDGTFRPNEPVTRAQLTLMAVRAVQFLGKPVPETRELPYADAGDIPQWAALAVSRATAIALVGGYPDRTFQADRPTTRAEAAVIIHRLISH